MTFDTVVGQRHITDTLKNAIRNRQLAQAFLFTGPRGVGKTTCARILAKTINCMNLGENIEPCNECESCVSFNRNASFNIHELDAASNNSVEDIRNLVDQVRIPPQVGRYKVYIIDEVHMLSQSAFNAFLKTLEEPPEYAKFILATTEKHKIIPTILSRCQIYDFKRIGVKDIAGHLDYVAGQEGITADEEALQIIAQKADGALRDALSMFDQLVSFTGRSLTYEVVTDNLNVLDYDYYFRVTDFLLGGQIFDALLTLNTVIESGFDGQHFLSGLGAHFRELLVGQDEKTIQLMEVGERLRERYLEQSRKCSPAFLLKGLDLIQKTDFNYKLSNNKRLLLEITIMQLSSINMPMAEPQAAVPAAPPKKKPEPEKPHQQVAEKQPVAKGPAPSAPPKKAEPPVEDKPAPKKAQKPAGGFFAGTISIKDDIDDEEDLENEEEEVFDFDSEEFRNTAAIDEEELTKAWTDFAQQIRKDQPNLFSTLNAAVPKIGDDFELLFDVKNAIQQKEIDDIKTDLLTYIRGQLNNRFIRLTSVVNAESPSIKPYGEEEKYQHLSAKNPALQELRKKFGLEIRL